MVDVRKKTIKDFLYDEKTKRCVFALLLGSVFFFALRFGYDDTHVAHNSFIVMTAFALYYYFDPKTKIYPMDFSTLMLVLAFYTLGMYKFINEPIIGKEYAEAIHRKLTDLIKRLEKFIAHYDIDEIDRIYREFPEGKKVFVK